MTAEELAPLIPNDDPNKETLLLLMISWEVERLRIRLDDILNEAARVGGAGKDDP
jgi:hypothetical protein